MMRKHVANDILEMMPILKTMTTTKKNAMHILEVLRKKRKCDKELTIPRLMPDMFVLIVQLRQ